MADAAAVILSAIQKLDSWLLQKTDYRNYQNSHAKLCSLQLEKKDLLVGMMEVWENSREMLYWLLVTVADLSNVKEKLHIFAGETVDLWEVNCREKLHSLLVQMMRLDFNFHRENVFSLVVEMADLWKDGRGKLNKEKLYTSLAKQTDLWEEDELFRFLEGMSSLEALNERMNFRRKDCKYVEWVRNDLRSILDLLNKLEDEGSSHSHLHYFMSDVVEMAREVQLLVHVEDSDPFILFRQLFRSSKVYIVNSSARSLLELYNEIKLIHKQLQELEKRMLKFGGDETSRINNVREELVGTSPTYSESDRPVVGLEEDVELLLRNAKTTISIHGLPGSGKTTLAREFYNHPEIVDGFECRAWVCLSSWKLSRKELLIELIRQFIESSEIDDVMIETMENKALQQMLHQHLQDKPYVIVLDDVSEVTDSRFARTFSDESTCLLQYVFRMLPQDRRSRLLFTTRNSTLTCNYFDCEHSMKNLDGDKSWQLLSAFFGSGDHEDIPKQLKKKGRDMLMRKCGGLPLAIKEVGRHWAEKRRSGSEWEEIIVEESLMSFELSETFGAMESTYLNMDPYDKQCFLCLAFFKEGAIFRKRKLEHIWTSAGMSVSYMIYKQLTQVQSIIEEVDETKAVSAKTIRINVHFHRLSIIKAVDEIGFEILRNDVSNRDSHEPRHHRVIHCSGDVSDHSYSSLNKDKRLVHLFFHGGGGLSDICWKHFERVKILDMEGFGLKILPETVGDLTELRYLGLRNNYIEELPQSLRRLKKIKVLDIAHNFMVEVPDILWEMDRLCHVYMSDIICQKPLKIDALMYLETLTYISVDNWTYEVSYMKDEMTYLEKLGIEEVDGNSNVSKLFASLAELKKLNCLILRGFRFRSMPSLDELGLLQNLMKLKLEGRLTKLPSANNFPPKIRFLMFVDSCLEEDPIVILEKLPELYDLKLQNAYTGHEMVISSDGFPSLRFLVIRELWNLRNVKVRKGGMRSLYASEIHSCPYLETVPQKILSRLDPLQSQSLKCTSP